MKNTSQPSSSRRAGKRRLSRRRICVAGGVLFLLFLGVAVYLRMRAGTTYEGRPEALLPAETVAVATMQDLTVCLESLENLPAFKTMSGDLPLGGWLMTAPLLHDDNADLSEKKIRLIAKAADRFLHRYFGREVTIALLPPKAPSPHSVVLVIVQATLGFEENLTELALLYNGDLNFETTEYQGTAIRRSQGSDLQKSFSYCRLGSTVILALRTDSPAPLQDVIDRSHDSESPNLLQTADFATHGNEAAFPGMRLFARPPALPRAVAAFPSEIARSASWSFWFRYFESKFQQSPWLTARVEVKKGINMVCTLPVPDGLSMPPSPGLAKEYARRLPPEAPFFMAIEHPDMGTAARELLDEMANTSAYKSKLERFEKQWHKATGAPLRQGWLAGKADTCILGVSAFYPGVMGPLPQVLGMLQYDTPTPPSAIADDVIISRSTLAGLLVLRPEGHRLGIALNMNPGPMSEATIAPSNLGTRPVLTEIPDDDPICFIALFQFSEALEALRRTGPPGGVWSLRTKEKVKEWKQLLGMLDGLGWLHVWLAAEENHWVLRGKLSLP